MFLLEALIWLVRLPFEAGKQLDEESQVGQSDWDRRSRKFWRCFAWVMTAFISAIVIAIGFFLFR
jgi:hypothetical protein